jgi:hypothetical protein
VSTEGERPVAPDLFSAAPNTESAALHFAPAVRAYGPRPVSNRPGLLRRILPYIAVIWGMLAILGAIVNGIVLSSSLSGPQLLGLALAILMVIGGSQEISSNHLRRARYLPWLMGFETAMVVIVVVALLVLHPLYPASVRTTFVDSCEARGGDAAHCGCVLSWFESNRSLAQFMADANGTVPARSQADMSEAAASCVSAT